MISRRLSKKILCSILTAGVLSIGGVQCVWANPVDSEGNGLTIGKQEVEGNGSGRYAYIVADGKEYSTDSDITINAQAEDGDSRIYAIAAGDDKDLTLNFEKLDIDMTTTESSKPQIRAIRNVGGDMIFNGDIELVANGTNNGFLNAVDCWDGGNIEFNGESIILTTNGDSVKANTVQCVDSNGEATTIVFNSDNTSITNDSRRSDGGKSWANDFVIEGANAKVIFNGNEVNLTSINDEYTAQNVSLISGGIIEFNADKTTLRAESYYGVNGIGGTGIAKFNNGIVNIIGEVNTSDGQGTSNAIGIFTVTQVSKNVEEFNINISGAGVESTNDGNTNGTAGIYAHGDDVTVAAKKLNVTVTPKSAHNQIAYGLRADVGAKISVSEDTATTINVGSATGDTSYNEAVGVYAGNFYDKYISVGSVEILGDTTINAYGKTDAKALYASDGGTITVGSEGKTVSLVGDVVADGENSVINIAGDAVFNGQDTEFTSTNNGTINLAGGNMSGVLNISEGSTVNLDGATFTTNEIASDITGGGKLVLKDSGVLSTTADQIFTSESGNVTATDEVNGILGSTAEKVTFESGTLSLNDAEYTLDFVNSAIDVMGKHEYESDKTSNTGIVMTGNLVGDLGENQITVDNAGALGNNAALDKVTVETEGNLLVGTIVNTGSGTTTVEGIKIEDSVVNGFNVGSLNLDEGSTGMVITNDKNVTLGGSAGGSIITVNGKNSDVTVVVGLSDDSAGLDVSNSRGSFTIGNALATSATEYTLNGSVTVNADSNLTTNGQTTITGGVTLNGGNLDAASGVLDLTGENNGITATGNSTITGTVNVGTLTGADGTVINVGNKDKAADVVVTNAELKGATVFLDPAWKDDNEITDASKMAVKDTTVDGNYVVGQNSVLSFGVYSTAEAQEVFAKTGLTWGEDDTTAALYIADTVDLTSGSVVVNGSLTEAPKDSISNGTFKAAANSVTMIDGSKFNDTTGEFAITNAASAEIAQNTESETDGAKLFIDNAKKGETYNVISGTGVGTAADDRWSTDNIDFDNTLLVVDEANTKVENNTFVVGAKYQTVDQAYGEGAVVIADVVDKTLEIGKDGDAAYDFFNAAASSKNNATKDAQVAAFNSAANMGEMGGVNHAAYSVSNAMTDAVADHLSIATHGDQDKDIWAHYVHNKENIEGISLGGINADYDLQYNGIVVGSDLYKNGKATAGIALSYIEGDVTNSNIASNTKNEAEYYGVSVYGRIDNGNSAVLGDITYMHGSSDITQQNSGYKLTADVDTDVFSIGVRAEQKVEAGVGQFVPYAGLRYMHIGTGNYTNSIGMSYDVDEQNLWLLPVGVTYSCEAQKGDWTIRPVVEAGYVWAMGDRDTNQTVSLNGAANGFGFDTADSGSFISRFAVEAEKANVVYSLGYEYQKGDTVKANKWMANMTFTF